MNGAALSTAAKTESRVEAMTTVMLTAIVGGGTESLERPRYPP